MRPDKNRRRTWFVVLMAAVVLLAGCGDDDGDTNAQAGTTTTTEDSGTTTTTEGGTSEGPVTTASNPLGEILVDADGLTLYVFDNDKDGTIACVDECAGAWPPVVLESGASLPTTGDLAAELTTVARPDGAQQVAYKARPLYRFAGDTKPGDTTGDNVANVWHVVKVGGGATSSSTGGGVGPY